ncbi:MAG TPA: zf-TFIIB domain-containing protein [Sandaracinaceae bacterium LLY-WYZ-13_1]|nr:zf-TFIIB domain-containing protein [Sandaracinaceae bacterium LLY-WYZ-13_1]
MRPCPRCAVAMSAHRQQFAEIDVCPQCGGTFFDAGEGVATLGADAEPKFLVQDGRARRLGPSTLRCPAHATATAGNYRSGPRTLPATDAPIMTLYEIGSGPDAVEVDHCPTCGGFFLDAGEDDELLALTREVVHRIETQSGARFAAPPGDAQADVVDGARTRSAYEEMMKGVFDWMVQKERRRRIRHRLEHRGALIDDD